MKTTIILAGFATLLFSCKPQAGKPTVSNETGKPYPLDTCLISGEKIGSMGTPSSLVYEGQQIKFCCEHCIPEFKKAPEKYVAMLK